MTKRYEFKFTDYDCNDTDDDYSPYPVASSIDSTFDFNTAVTWDIILWQFCKFLESTGYESVREKIRLVDNFGIMTNNHLFTCIYEPEFDFDKAWGEQDDAEEDEEETSEEEKVTVSYKDMKDEIQ